MIVDRIEHHLGVKTSVFGFDTGKGLPRLRTCGIAQTFSLKGRIRWILTNCADVFDELS